MPYLNLVEPWDQDPPRRLVDTRIFTLYERQARSRRSTKHGTFVYLESVDWVNVVAITPDDEVVMVEQFRHGTGEVTLEIPGGMVDPGETPLEAGLRELREESGYAPASTEAAQIIGEVTPNPAIITNRCHTVLVPAATSLGAPEPEGNEELALQLVPASDIPSLVRDGTIHHALVVAGIHHWRLWRDLG